MTKIKVCREREQWGVGRSWFAEIVIDGSIVQTDLVQSRGAAQIAALKLASSLGLAVR